MLKLKALTIKRLTLTMTKDGCRLTIVGVIALFNFLFIYVIDMYTYYLLL